MALRISLALLFLGLTGVMPFFFDEILLFLVEKLNFGWVLSTITIRLATIIFAILGVAYLLSLFKGIKKRRTLLAIVIGLTVGFGWCFVIAPIYDIDYGMLNDGKELDNVNRLTAASETYDFTHEPTVIGFLTVHCGFCKLASKRLAINIRNGQTIPVELFFTDKKEEIARFLAENNAENLSTHILKSDDDFLQMGGLSFPSLYLVDAQGKTVYHWVGEELNYTALDYLKAQEQ